MSSWNTLGNRARERREERALPFSKEQACSKQCSSVGTERKVPSVAVISQSRNTGFGVPRGLENERKLASKCTDLSRTAPFDKCCQINLFSPKKREKRSKNEGRERNLDTLLLGLRMGNRRDGTLMAHSVWLYDTV